MKGPRRCSRSRKWDVATSECHRRLSEEVSSEVVIVSGRG